MTNAHFQLEYPSLEKSNLAWSTPIWSDEFIIKFDIRIDVELTQTLNILHVCPESKTADDCEWGHGYPSVYAGTDNSLIIFMKVNDIMMPQFSVVYDYILNKSYHIEISQKKNSNGEAVYTIIVDGTTFEEVINTTPHIFQNATLYLSDPWYTSFAPHGNVSNLRIINGGKSLIVTKG